MSHRKKMERIQERNVWLEKQEKRYHLPANVLQALQECIKAGTLELTEVLEYFTSDICPKCQGELVYGYSTEGQVCECSDCGLVLWNLSSYMDE